VVELTKMMESFSLDDEDKNFTYEQLVQGLKSGYFKNIFVMTGAGISVSCGIPDFRSPGTGLYDNLQQYDLPHPEAIFTLDFFLEKPQAFYEFAQNFDLTKFDPSPTHFFIKMLNDKGILVKNATQNIDNLEEKTGIPMEKVV
jgi:NAD+-dependent protein deacetylase sirtuin 2